MASWWIYVAIAVILIAAVVIWIMYRGYSNVKPKPLPGKSPTHAPPTCSNIANCHSGITCPALSHGILGHPEKMLHPLKHELRLELCDTLKDAVHQVFRSTYWR